MMREPMLRKYPDDSANRDYDLFEEFADGSTVWRACVFGMENAERKLRELARESNNKFFAMNLQDRTRPVIRRVTSPAGCDLRRAS